MKDEFTIDGIYIQQVENITYLGQITICYGNKIED